MLQMMTDLEDEEDWAMEDEVEDVRQRWELVAAEAALDRLARSRRQDGHAAHHLGCSNAPDQKSGNTGTQVMAISASAEGCKKAMEANMSSIVMACLPYITDEHPRVRFACCNALGQMASDFPTSRRGCMTRCCPDYTLCWTMMVPRVQSHTAAASCKLLKNVLKNVLLPYLQTLSENASDIREKRQWNWYKLTESWCWNKSLQR